MEQSKYQTINEYISLFPDNVKKMLQSIRQTISQTAPQAEETINYQIPTFKLNGKNLVHFAGYKNHIGFYPTASGIKAFQKELSRWPSAKGSVRFPLDQPLPVNLIKEIVKFRVKEIMKK